MTTSAPPSTPLTVAKKSASFRIQKTCRIFAQARVEKLADCFPGLWKKTCRILIPSEGKQLAEFLFRVVPEDFCVEGAEFWEEFWEKKNPKSVLHVNIHSKWPPTNSAKNSALQNGH